MTMWFLFPCKDESHVAHPRRSRRRGSHLHKCPVCDEKFLTVSRHERPCATCELDEDAFHALNHLTRENEEELEDWAHLEHRKMREG